VPGGRQIKPGKIQASSLRCLGFPSFVGFSA
jgi:hypothetical protein